MSAPIPHLIRRRRLAAIVAAGALALAGCGTRGDLYLPERKPPPAPPSKPLPAAKPAPVPADTPQPPPPQ